MKTVRFMTLIIVLAIAFSVLTPSIVLAKPGNAALNSSIVEKTTKSTLVKISVTNKTGGTIFISLSGAHNYSFAATQPGKNTFEIQPGKYTYTLSTSACRGSITKTGNFKSGNVSLGQWQCRK